eukprot:s2571_g2.t1
MFQLLVAIVFRSVRRILRRQFNWFHDACAAEGIRSMAGYKTAPFGKENRRQREEWELICSRVGITWRPSKESSSCVKKQYEGPFRPWQCYGARHATGLEKPERMVMGPISLATARASAHVKSRGVGRRRWHF